MAAARKTGRAGKASVIFALTVMSASVPCRRALATEFNAFDRKTQVHESSLIITGRVLGVRSAWNASHSAITTEAEVSVDEVWKGAPAADRLVVRTFGGKVAGVALEVEGAAKFSPGERVVLFLRRENGAYAPLGMRFGKYEIVDAGGAMLAVGHLPPEMRGAGNTPAVSQPLTGLRGEIARIVEEEGK